MNSMNQVYAALRRKNRSSYNLLMGCCFISVLLICAFGVMMNSGAVQTMLPEGGDSRKQMTMVFTLAIAGCAVFTTYASTLFFRSKSREMGIYMALGVSKKRLAGLLYRDLALIAAVSGLAGLILGAPLAAGIWQIFLLAIGGGRAEMAFSLSINGFIWPLAFLVFTTLVLFLLGRRFIRRGNIMDVVNEQRRSEPVRDVKGWYGIGGAAMMLLGALAASLLPGILADRGYTPPFWIKLFYVVAAAGLYLLLVYIVVRGFGGKKRYYKNIITRSMMKFQGRATVLNMCVITVLIMAGYFSMFYSPIQVGPAMVGYDERPVHYAFHHRVDEAAVPGRAEIDALAADMGVTITDFTQADFVNLATDGYDRNWTDDGRYGNEYYAFYQELPFFSESAFNLLTGKGVDVAPGGYLYVTYEGYRQNPYAFIEEMKLFTNPDTKETLAVAFQGETHYAMLLNSVILDDGDYAALTAGLSDEWRESRIHFNVENVNDTYDFARTLKNAIIDGSTEKSAVFEIYDRVERLNAHAAGEEYRGDTDPDLQVSYDLRDSTQFNLYWEYIPQFVVAERQDFVLNMAVFLMLFIFMAVICLAAVAVIAYTRCMTIAQSNLQVYDDLRHLGAKRDYLYHSLKGQVSRVFLIPALIGTVGITGFFTLLMFSNSGGIEKGELVAFGIIAALLAVVSLGLWGLYRMTLGRSAKMLKVDKA